MKDGLDGRIIKEFVASRRMMYSYVTDDGYADRKKSDTINMIRLLTYLIRYTCITKRKKYIEDYKNCLKNKAKMLRLYQRFRNKTHNAVTKMQPPQSV